jgi:hypothetical protein
MLNTSIRASIVSLDEENPISLSTEEMRKEIQKAAVDYYTKYNQCKVHAYALHHMPTHGCTKEGEPIDKFQCVVVVNYGKRWEHAVDVDMLCTKSKKVEHKPDSSVPIPQLYDVWDTTTDFSRQGMDATDPEKPIPKAPEINRGTYQIQG